MTVDAVSPSRCVGCHACFNICPVRAITMVENEEGFKYPQLDKQTCVNCGKCEKVCPALIGHPLTHDKSPEFYAVWNKENDIRRQSSSGGMFRILAEEIIAEGGVVYGAAFDEANHLRHIRVENVDELGALMGSKYVQSDIGTMLGQVRADLRNGRQVLFSGTPCQVAGLYAFLGGNHENLLTVDVLCHGVPSPGVFQRYLEGIGVDGGCRIEFRNKDKGWKRFSLIVADKVHEMLDENSYMKGFLSNLYLRPSCAECQFVGCKRIGDVTLGDFWGVNAFRKKYDDDLGTSLVLLNSQKGKLMFEALRSRYALAEQVPDASAIPANPTLMHSSTPSLLREAFFADYKSGLSWQELEEKYMSSSAPFVRRKVGILNLQHSPNFGACLVAYALQTAIERCGSRATIIDYRLWKKSRLFSKAYRREKAENKNFEKFRNKFLKRTKPCYDADDLALLNARFDTFVTGSDQVWRFRYVYRSLKEFLLAFAAPHKTLFSYAASLGIDYWEGNDEATETVCQNLQRFNSISVREESGVDICRDMFGVEAVRVIDPTLLLGAEDYEPVMKNEKSVPVKPYLAKMILDENPETEREIVRLAKEKGWDIIDIYGEKKMIGGKETVVCRSVGEWLKLLQNAAYVLTDSFHCVCFSVLFRRPFTCVINPVRGASRLENLLGILGLRHRLVAKLDGYFLDENATDYDEVNKILAAERQKGYDYLKNCLCQPGKSLAPKKRVQVLYLFGFLPLGRKIVKGEVEIFKLFNIIPLMKIQNLPTRRKYFLGGFMPLLTLKNKGRSRC